MSTRIPAALKRLSACSIVYVAWSFAATALAIADNRPAGFAGWSTGLPVVQDFLYGMGTAMSPPLYFLVMQMGLTALALRRDRWGATGIIGLAVCGLFSVIGALGEPILLEIFNPVKFDGLKALVYAGMILIPLGTASFGILAWAGRHGYARKKETV